MSSFFNNIISAPFRLIGFILSIPGKILNFLFDFLKKLIDLIKKIILAPFKIILYILSIPFKPFKWIFGKKRKYSDYQNSYSVTSDPSMTRWENRYCESCRESTSHKIARLAKGSDRAVVNCTKCKIWEEEYW